MAERFPIRAVLLFCLLVVLPGFARAAGKPASPANTQAGTWTALGSGLNGSVNDLAVLGTRLIAGGSFTQAGGLPAYSIAAWDGTSWSPFGSGLKLGIYNATVNAIAAHNGQLVAVGQFTEAGGVAVQNVALWDGTSWSALGAGLKGDASGVASFDGKIFAARTQAFPPYGVQQAYIEWWNGSAGLWYSSGTFGPPQGSDWIRVNALDAIGDRLYMGSYATSVPGSSFAYNGTTWQYIGQASYNLYAYEQFGGELFAGGAGALVEKYTPPSTWTSLDPAWVPECGFVFDMQLHNGALIAGGRFTAGCMPNPNVVAWDGSSWSGLGAGMNGDVKALTEFNSHLIAGGNFTAADGSPAARIAQWNESPVATRKTTLGAVKALFSGTQR
ncbi:MAG TPA: hypothetical protein VF247_06065 [Candidatus Krumholzibacteria bacterium]